MDRLVKIDAKELHLSFTPNQRCSATFKLTNLMHTMSVAISLTTATATSTATPTVASTATSTATPLFSFSPNPLSILPPLSSSTFSLHLSHISPHPPLSPPHSLLLRSSPLPTGKQDLRRLFSAAGPHIFLDATIPISFSGRHVAEFILSGAGAGAGVGAATLNNLSKAIAGCSAGDLTSLLRSAVVSANPSFVSDLIQAGGDVNARDLDGRSLLYSAVRSGNVDVVRVLIGSGCKVEDGTRDLISLAARSGNVDVVRVLVESGCKVDESIDDSSSRTPVHVCAIHGHLDALKLCVEMGGDPDRPDFNGSTPLHLAAESGKIESVKFLLDCSLYSKYAINKDGKTPFLVAVENGNSHLLDLLQLSDVLNRAARIGDEFGLKNCVINGGEVNVRDQNGWTPLHRAAFKGKIECVKALIAHGAEMDVVDDVGYTPLHCAVEAGRMEVAVYLIANGARANLKSLKGVCNLNLDFHKNHPAFVSTLCGENEQA